MRPSRGRWLSEIVLGREVGLAVGFDGVGRKDALVITRMSVQQLPCQCTTLCLIIERRKTICLG